MAVEDAAVPWGRPWAEAAARAGLLDRSPGNPMRRRTHDASAWLASLSKPGRGGDVLALYLDDREFYDRLALNPIAQALSIMSEMGQLRLVLYSAFNDFDHKVFDSKRRLVKRMSAESESHLMLALSDLDEMDAADFLLLVEPRLKEAERAARRCGSLRASRSREIHMPSSGWSRVGGPDDELALQEKFRKLGFTFLRYRA